MGEATKTLQEMAAVVELSLNHVAKAQKAEHRGNQEVQQLAEKLQVSEKAKLDAETTL